MRNLWYNFSVNNSACLSGINTQKEKFSMKKFLSATLLVIIMNICIYSAVISAQNEALCSKFLRVHVIANSDSSFDQGVKIAVRANSDAITMMII